MSRSNKRFHNYCIIGFGLTAMVFLLCQILDATINENSLLRPGFGTANSCFLRSKVFYFKKEKFPLFHVYFVYSRYTFDTNYFFLHTIIHSISHQLYIFYFNCSYSAPKK